MTEEEKVVICDLCETQLGYDAEGDLNEMHDCISTDDYLEKCPDWALATSNLFRWSWNYKWGESPLMVFLILIQHPLGDYHKKQQFQTSSLGYYELSKIGLALDEYSARPLDVISWLEKALRIDARNG